MNDRNHETGREAYVEQETKRVDSEEREARYAEAAPAPRLDPVFARMFSSMFPLAHSPKKER